MLTIANLQAGCGASSSAASAWLAAIQAACNAYQINTPLRLAAFLATIGVESASLTATSENLNYSAQGLANTWGRYSVTGKPGGAPNAQAIGLAHDPEAIANNCYAGRNGNGDEASGDGWAFIGRGPIQITGRAAYTACGAALGLDLVHHPELLAQPVNGALAAAWYWSKNNLNALADGKQFTAISKAVNCGSPNSPLTPNGMPQRLKFYAAACASQGC